MTPSLYDSIPEQLPIRIVTPDAVENSRTEAIEVVTTLLDPKAYPASESASEMLGGLRCKVYCMLDAAMERTKANKRSTVKAQDL